MACAVKFSKTELCRYHPKCHRGDQCLYAHSEAELRARPNFTKTRMCAGYRDGRCKLSATDCPFAHGRRELRPMEPAKAKAPRAARGRPRREAAPRDAAPHDAVAHDASPMPRLDSTPFDVAKAGASTASGRSTPTASNGPASGSSTPPRALGLETSHEDLAVWSRTVAHSLADLAGSNGEFTVVARLRV